MRCCLKKPDVISEINNKDESIVSNYVVENTTNNYMPSTESHTDMNIIETSYISNTATEFKEHYYQLYDDVANSWEEAEEYCESLGGHLAVINDADENDFLFSYMIEQGYSSAYFGYTDRESEGTWTWVDKSNSSYINWATGEPNSQNSEENYAMFHFKFTDGSWNDGQWGDDTASFICEWESTTSDSLSSSTAVDISEDTTNKIEVSDNINSTIAELTDFYGAIKEITSSSQLSEEIIGNVTHNYAPSKVVDDDLSTCWCEGKDDYGIGENLTITFDSIYSIRYITIWNGLCTDEDLYRKNSRVHNIRITFSDGASIDYECQDGWENRKSTFKLPVAIETSSVTFQILDVYEGEKYKDTCISEISIP